MGWEKAIRNLTASKWAVLLNLLSKAQQKAAQ